MWLSKSSLSGNTTSFIQQGQTLPGIEPRSLKCFSTREAQSLYICAFNRRKYFILLHCIKSQVWDTLLTVMCSYKKFAFSFVSEKKLIFLLASMYLPACLLLWVCNVRLKMFYILCKFFYVGLLFVCFSQCLTVHTVFMAHIYISIPVLYRICQCNSRIYPLFHKSCRKCGCNLAYKPPHNCTGVINIISLAEVINECKWNTTFQTH